MKNPGKVLQDRALKGNLDAFPGIPIVEIAGDSRVLIENHLCVREYSLDRIRVKMRYGYLCINGNHLRLAQMTAQQLVITGYIDSVVLQRGE